MKKIILKKCIPTQWRVGRDFEGQLPDHFKRAGEWMLGRRVLWI